MSGIDSNINGFMMALTTLYVSKHEHELVVRENEKLLSDCEKLQSKILSYETAHQQLNYTITAHERTIETLRNENEQLKIQLALLTEKINKLEIDNVQLKADNVELKADNVQLKADNVQLKADNVQLKADNVQLKADNVQLKADNVQLKADIVELKTDNVKLKHIIDDLSYDKQSSKLLCLVDDFNDTFNLQNTLLPPLDSTLNQNRKQRNRDCHFWLHNDSLDLSRYKMVSGLTKLKNLPNEFKSDFESDQGFPSGFLNTLVSELDGIINTTYNLSNIQQNDKKRADRWLNCLDM